MVDSKEIVMDFRDAFDYLQDGYAIKRAGWLGYWISDGVEVSMHCKDGRVVTMSSGCEPIFTLSHCAANDWMVLDSDQQEELDRIHASRILAKEP